MKKETEWDKCTRIFLALGQQDGCSEADLVERANVSSEFCRSRLARMERAGFVTLLPDGKIKKRSKVSAR